MVMYVVSNEELELIKKLTLMDDLYMSKYFEGNKEGIQLILRLILDKEDLVVVDVQIQTQLINFVYHSTRFDVLAKDMYGRKYDIEFQVASFPELAKRSRYYGSEMDHTMLEKGKEYTKLEESYVIFICAGDVFEKGKPMHHFTMKDDEGMELNDGRHAIMINAYHPGDWRLKDLMNDLTCADPEKMRYDILKKRAQFLKEKEAGQMYVSKALGDWYKKKYFEEEQSWKDKLALLERKNEEELAYRVKLMLSDGEPIEKIVRYTSLSKEEIEQIKLKMNE